MPTRKLWSLEEDQFLSSLLTSFEAKQKKIKWRQISQLVRIQNSDWKRNGKQCKQRWINHLSPSLQKFKQIDVEKLFELMRLHVRKWNLISKQMPGKADNQIKNFFYISLRKGFRKLNKYIGTIRNPKRYKLYRQELLEKILLIHDQKKNKQLVISSESADELANEIRQNLIRCSTYDIKQPTSLTQDVLLFFENLNQKVQKFSKICKFKKSKHGTKQFDQTYQYLSRKKNQNELEVQQNTNVMIKQQQQINEQQMVNLGIQQNNKIIKKQTILKEQTINQMYNYIYQIPQQFLIKYQPSEMYQLAYRLNFDNF